MRHSESGGVSPGRTVALTTMMNEHDDLISRLRAFGRRPVDAGLAARHLSAMATPSLADAPRRRHQLRVVAAFAVGLLAGTTGLATAGALPNGAQEIAHHTLGSFGVNVPHGDRYQGPGCGGAKNHGQYVRSRPKGDRAAAAASRCGKPLGAGAGDDGSGDGNGGAPGKAAGCQGPPPWAGKGKPDQAAKDARKQACGDHDGDGDEAGGDPKAGEGQTAPTPAPEAVPAPETTSPGATTPPGATTAPGATTPPVTAQPSATTTTVPVTTSTTTPSDDTTSTTAVPVPVPGLGS